MATQIGVIQHIEGTRAIVAVSVASGCGTCAKRGGCGIGAGTRGDKSALVDVEASPGLRPGDTVTVCVDDAGLLPAALLGYLLPAVALIAGAVAGHASDGSDGTAAIGALAGLAVGLALPRVLLRHLPRLRPSVQITPHK